MLPVSDFNGRWAVRGGAPADRVRTLHNGVDPRELPVLEDEPAVPTLVFAGRIDPLKDLDTLVREFALVLRQARTPAAVFGGYRGNEASRRNPGARDGTGPEGAHLRGRVAGGRRRVAAGHVVVQSACRGAAADGHRGRDLRRQTV